MVRCSKCGAFMPVIRIETSRRVYYCSNCGNYQEVPPRVNITYSNKTDYISEKQWRVSNGTKQR